MMDRPVIAALGAGAVWNAVASFFDTPIALAGGVQCVVSCAPAQASAPLWLRARIEGLRESVWLGVRALPLEALSGVAVGLADLQTLPADMRHELVVLALEPLRAALPFGDITLEATDAPPHTLPERRLACTLQQNAAVYELLVAADVGQLHVLLERIGPRHGAPRFPEAVAAQIPVPLAITLAAQTLPLRALAALEPGDALVLPDASRITLRFAHGGAVRLSAPPAPVIEDITMSDSPPSSPAAPSPVAQLDDLPVEVSVLLGTTTLSLAQLRALGPGADLPLAVPQAEPGAGVSLLANGRVIGTGQLLGIDDQIAVRIVSLFDAAPLSAGSAPDD